MILTSSSNFYLLTCYWKLCLSKYTHVCTLVFLAQVNAPWFSGRLSPSYLNSWNCNKLIKTGNPVWFSCCTETGSEKTPTRVHIHSHTCKQSPKAQHAPCPDHHPNLKPPRLLTSSQSHICKPFKLLLLCRAGVKKNNWTHPTPPQAAVWVKMFQWGPEEKKAECLENRSLSLYEETSSSCIFLLDCKTGLESQYPWTLRA